MSLKINAKQLDVNRRLEIYAVIDFIATYRRLLGGWPTLVNMPQPPEPDFIIKLDSREVGVEVAHLYGSERDARLLLGHSRPEEFTLQARVAHATVPLNIRVPFELNRILSHKATKGYPRSTWLLIRNAYPLWEKRILKCVARQLPSPGEHPFEQIWLLCHQQSTSGMLRLFPFDY